MVNLRLYPDCDRGGYSEVHARKAHFRKEFMIEFLKSTIWASMIIVHSEGVVRGRIDLNSFVALTATHRAKNRAAGQQHALRDVPVARHPHEAKHSHGGRS
jgi:hypothetical protein